MHINDIVSPCTGEANAVLAKAEAKAKAIRLLSEALTRQNGNAAASLTVAEQYVSAFSNLAKESNTILLPSNTGDISSMVTQAMAIYGSLSKTKSTAESVTAETNEPILEGSTVSETETGHK
ncbi:stomatin-like protein 2, mitochondrial [Sinocyclocheilus rhinocerous]|uniref:stomatin-like protein 2, mitochondrial n=1 Tax=Sinocyclocheilus rhinocerous TaxID=307959 RepID=UPI0007BA7370|nr:PREDICTED: stomatin-like protein 2, mitochondrial [Sinocyclocheilus rhinocerous]